MMPRLPHKTCPKASRHLLRGGGRSHKQSNWVNPSRPKKTQRESPYLIRPPAFCMDSGKKEWGGRRSNNAERHSRGRREDRRIRREEEEEDRGWLPPKERGGVFAGVPSFLPRFAPGDERRKTQPAPPSSPILSRQQ